jgi:hypothetical protein
VLNDARAHAHSLAVRRLGLARLVARARRDGWHVAGDTVPGPGKRFVVLPARRSKYFLM